jgi:hypothetical protein
LQQPGALPQLADSPPEPDAGGLSSVHDVTRHARTLRPQQWLTYYLEAACPTQHRP